MRNQPDTVHEYNLSRLNWIFALASLAFLGSVIWMVYDDWQTKKPWKKYQRQFQRIESDKLAKEAQEAQKRAEQQGLAQVLADLDAQKKKIEENRKVVTALDQEKDAARVAFELADLKYKFEKASLDAQKSRYDKAVEEAKHTHPDWSLDKIRDEPRVREEAGTLETLDTSVSRLHLDAENAELRRKDTETALNKLIGQRQELEKQRDALLSNKTQMEKRRGTLNDKLVQTVLNAPLVEFARPQLTFNQKVIETYTMSVNFVEAKRVDRCMTCHVAADLRSAFPSVPSKEKRQPPFDAEKIAALADLGRKQGYLHYGDIEKWASSLDFPAGTPKGLTTEEWNHTAAALRAARVSVKDFYATLEQPYRNHPRLDLFVASDSPHPVEKFGCTACHWGWDRETEFNRAEHTPDDEKQKAEWIEKYHWRRTGFFDQPMYARRYLEASCLKCHTQVTEVPRADKLNHGRALIETAGCYGCHVISQLETQIAHKIERSQAVDPAVAFNPKLTLAEKRAAVDASLTKIAQLYGVSMEELKDSRFNILTKPADLLPDRIINIPLRTLHKRGPSLEKIASKTTPEWTRQWLTSPRTFRGNTWMPHFWGLENSAAPKDDPRDGMVRGPARDALEINALTTYLFAISETKSYPAPPTGDAVKGKVLVENLGCAACHIVGKSYDALREEKLAKLKAASTSPAETAAEMARFERNLLLRSRGPSLDGLARKTNAAWVFAWIKNPRQYHPTTRMPDLRLSDQEATDLAAYLMTLLPANPPPLLADLSDYKLRSGLDALTQEYLESGMPRVLATAQLQDMTEPASRALGDGHTESELEKYLQTTLGAEAFEAMMAEDKTKREGFEAARLELGQQRLAALQADATTQKNLFLGRKLVDRYGCFGCHDIKGFEKAKPIAPELTEWGSKHVRLLDFGYKTPQEVPRVNIAFFNQKLHAPRSLDKVDTKKPQEFLRMPQFNLSDEQIEAIATHILGQTNEKISAQGRRNLTRAEQEIENGRWLVKELNCVGCHVFEGKGEMREGVALATYGKGGAIRDTIADKTYWPPSLFSQGHKTQPQWLFKFLKNPAPIRPAFFPETGHARMPTFGLTDEQINVLVRYFAALDNQSFPFEGDTLEFQPTAESVKAGAAVFNQFQCVKCHNIVLGRPVTPAQLVNSGPNLAEAKTRLKPSWVLAWLKDPQQIAPGTNMPTYPFTDEQMRAVRDFLWTYPGPKPEEIAKPAAPGKTESFE